MAGITSDLALSSEIRLVNGVHHADHAPRRLLSWVVVGVLGPAASALRAMAIGAGFAQGSGEESHGCHELVHGNALQHSYVLENLLRQRGLFLPVRAGHPEQTRNHR